MIVRVTASTPFLPPQGKLSLYSSGNGTEHVFTLRGVGERPLPVSHVLVLCTVGETTHTQLDVPNYSQRKLSLQVHTFELSVTRQLISWERARKGNVGVTTAYFSCFTCLSILISRVHLLETMNVCLHCNCCNDIQS